MASSRNRQRALARAKLERQMARRAAAARKRRQTLAIIGIAVAVIVVLGGGGLIVWTQIHNDKGGQHDKKNPQATQADSCYAKAKGSNPKLKDVGMPDGDDAAKSGPTTMTITTNRGTIDVTLDPAKAPCNVHSFAYLAGKKFFDNTPCHRLTTKASGLRVLQCGDPSGTGQGGPTYTVKDENLPTKTKKKQPSYPAGTVAVANTGQPHTGSSQFFIVYGDTDLPAKYSVIGKVSKGLDVVKKVAKAGVKPDPSATSDEAPSDGAPKKKVTIKTLRVGGGSPSATASASATGAARDRS